MPSSESPAWEKLRQAFPENKPFPPVPYRGLAFGEARAEEISSLGHGLNGLLTTPARVRFNTAKLMTKPTPENPIPAPKYTEEEIEGYGVAMEARHAAFAEGLSDGRITRIRSLMVVTALDGCWREMAERITSLAGQGYEVGFIETIPPESLGEPGAASTVALKGDGFYGAYAYSENYRNRELWFPGDQARVERYNAAHDALWAGAMTLADAADIAELDTDVKQLLQNPPWHPR